MAVKVVVEISGQIRREVIGDSDEPREIMAEGWTLDFDKRFYGLNEHLSAIVEVSSLRQANTVILDGCCNAHGGGSILYARPMSS